MITTLEEYKKELQMFYDGFQNFKSKSDIDAITTEEVLDEYEQEKEIEQDFIISSEENEDN